MKRSLNEKLFLILFLPTVIGFYLIYKYPTWFVPEHEVPNYFYFWGKSTGFWYHTVYTLIVCGIALWILINNKAVYGKNKKKVLSKYQKSKFLSIFLSQLIAFYFIPFWVPALLSSNFWDTQFVPVNKDAYIYVYNGFTSAGGFLYTFAVVPASVWYFGKRYCSWFCACGNLAETIGATKWGNRWVTQHTPRSPSAKKWELLQYLLLGFSIIYGFLLLLNLWNVITAPSLISSLKAFQDLAVDLIFGALIGVGVYPFLGTRIWCRYGCPLAAGMRLVGKWGGSRFQVVANDKCKGLNLCTTQCPMGIDVASYAHKDKVPIKGSFGLQNSPCIGCGGCIDICPTQALAFEQILKPKQQPKPTA